MKTCRILGTASLFLVSTLGAAIAQTAPQSTPPASGSTAATGSMSPDNPGTYATGKPLEQQSKEGFWGHMNPFARKKWVSRQVDPIKDRTNELDQLQAKNANDIRDVDSRATSGVNRAMSAANAADAHAADASSRADRANSVAVAANGRTNSLNGTISNLDQYTPVSSTELPFVAGHTVLGAKAKASLDDMATSLAAQKGYIIEVQGYSRGGVQSSQAMADSVVRYLVTAHQVPVYRIYRTGLGKQVPAASAATATASATGNGETEKPLTNGVRVTVLHNSLASMDAPSGSSAPATTGVSTPHPGSSN